MAESLDISSGTVKNLKDLKIDPKPREIGETDLPPSKIIRSNLYRSIDVRSNSSPEIVTSASSTSTHLDLVNNARRPTFPSNNSSLWSSLNASGGVLPESVEAKMRAFQSSRQGTPTRPLMNIPSPPDPYASVPSKFPTSVMNKLSPGLRLPVNQRPQPHNIASAPILPKIPNKGGLSARRGMKLSWELPCPNTLNPVTKSNSSEISDGNQIEHTPSLFNKFSEYVDTKNGTLKFAGKAVVHGHGINFTSGSNFSISLDEVDMLEELGKGNYGTVYKVRHARPKIRRPGLGLAGYGLPSKASSAPIAESNNASDSPSKIQSSTTGLIMAMKEIRLELDEAKFAAIIMELDILHRCNSPHIIDFYGAFFQEGAVYICIEFMDGGSIDKIYANGVPENILRKITYATVQGLKTLKDDHNIIHRDVKPTNILVNTRGQVKICDFGVSGNLVASIAKTNIGCQSYMAPERITAGGTVQSGSNGNGTYSVQSDIWSLGLTIIECALGRYPYPPETYNNIFSQLSAIVDGEPPNLPKDLFSPQIRDFVHDCLNKTPMLRPTYSMLLQHSWLAQLSKPETISEEDESIEATGDRENSNFYAREVGDKEVADWVINALEKKKNGKLTENSTPALHAAPLSSVPYKKATSSG